MTSRSQRRIEEGYQGFCHDSTKDLILKNMTMRDGLSKIIKNCVTSFTDQHINQPGYNEPHLQYVNVAGPELFVITTFDSMYIHWSLVIGPYSLSGLSFGSITSTSQGKRRVLVIGPFWPNNE